MKLLTFVLNQTEKLDELLTEFAHMGIGGGTILESTGMARVLGGHHDEEDIPFLGSLRSLLDPQREKSRTILLVLSDEMIPVPVDAFERVVGDLSHRDTGIAFSVPIDFVKGLPTGGAE